MSTAEALRASLMSTQIPQHEGGGYEVTAADAFIVSLIDRCTAMAQQNAALEQRLARQSVAKAAPVVDVDENDPMNRGDRPSRVIPLSAWRWPAIVAAGVLGPLALFVLS